MSDFNNIVVTKITEAIKTAFPTGLRHTMHNRKNYGLSFCSSGQITYTHKGKDYLLDKDTVIILPKNQDYSFHVDKTGVFPILNFDCIDDISDEFVSIQVSSSEPYIKDFESIRHLYTQPNNTLKTLSILYNILHRLSQNRLGNPLLARAINYIEKNYGDSDLTIGKIAQEHAISEVYLRKLFEKNMSTSPKQFLLDVRINHAKQLLSEGVLKVNSIGAKCGFSNPYHFCRLFKSKVGMTPTKYSLKNKISNI